MSADSEPGGRQPSDQAYRLELWVRRYATATIHITIAIYYYYCCFSARKLILILPSYAVRVKGWVGLGTAVRVWQPVPKAVCRSGCRDKHNWDLNLLPLTPQLGILPLYHCDLLVEKRRANHRVLLSVGAKFPKNVRFPALDADEPPCKNGRR